MAVSLLLRLRLWSLFGRNAYPRRHALTNKKEPAVRSWQRSFDQKQVVGRINLDQRVVPRRHLVRAHVTAHAQALFGLAALATPGCVRCNRTRRAVLSFGSMRCGLTTEMM